MKATLLLYSSGDAVIRPTSSITLDPQPGPQVAAQAQKWKQTTKLNIIIIVKKITDSYNLLANTHKN